MSQYLLANSLSANPWLIWLIILWILPWKGIALWKAARNEHKWWFIALLVLNTLAILEIIYIFFFSKKKGIIEKKEEKVKVQEQERAEE
jgi:membrane protein DedA with SNARE-associated domain